MFISVSLYFDFYSEPLYATSSMYEGSSFMTETMGGSIIVVTLIMVKEGNCMKRIGDKSDDSRSS